MPAEARGSHDLHEYRPLRAIAASRRSAMMMTEDAKFALGF
jgi:hypothetical protein